MANVYIKFPGLVQDGFPTEPILRVKDASNVLIADYSIPGGLQGEGNEMKFELPTGTWAHDMVFAGYTFTLMDEYADGVGTAAAGVSAEIGWLDQFNGMAENIMSSQVLTAEQVTYITSDGGNSQTETGGLVMTLSAVGSWPSNLWDFDSISSPAAAPAAPTRTRLKGSKQINLELSSDGIAYETMEEASAASALLGSVTSPFIDLALMKVEVPEGAYDSQNQPYAPANYGLVQAKVAFEAARATAAESDIQADVDANQVASELADSTLTTNLAAEAARAVAAEAGIQADVDQNEADADAAMATEQAARIAGDAAVQANLTAYEASNDAAVGVERVRIDTLLSGSSVDFDTLLEITSAYQLADVSVIASIVALQADVDQNEIDSDAAEATLTADLASEAARALAAEGVIQADVDANQVVMDTEFASNLVDRAAIRSEFAAGDVLQYQAMIAAVAVAQADVDANEADGDTDRALIRTEMATASTARDASVEAIRAALQADVDQNESDSDAADAVHTANISAEIARATAAEGVNSAGLAQEILDRAAALTALELKHDTEYLAESTSRQAADAAIQADVDANEAAADAAIAALQADVDGNETDGDDDRAAIRSEIAAAKIVDDAALAALQADVDGNELDGDNDRALIRSEIAAAKIVDDAALAALQSDVDGNESDADASFVAATADRAAVRAEIAAAKIVDDAALAALQADVDGNELDGDNDRASIRTELAAGDAAERAFALAARDANETARDSGIAAAKAVADLALAAAKSVADAELAAEAAARIAADDALGSRIDDVLENVDPAALDSLTEIITEMQSISGSLSDSIISALGTHTSELAAHEAAYVAKMALLDAEDIDIRFDFAVADSAERAFALAARNVNEAARDSSIAAAKVTADAALVAAKSVADAEMAQEVSDRAAGDAAERAFALAARDANETARDSSIATAKSAADIALAAAKSVADAEMAQEVSDRIAGDAAERAFALAARDANETARDLSIAAAKVTADAALAAEEAARIAADGVIQADVDANELSADTSFQAAGVDRALVRSEFAAADASALAASLLAASTEQALRIAAEAVIQADVDQNEADADAAMVTEIARAEAAELVLTNALAQEVVDRTADVDAEEARALAAEALMLSNSQADLASLQGRHYQVAFPTLTSDGSIGVIYDMSAQAGWPLASLSYLSLNGMILTSGADFDYVVDGNGNLTGWQMLIPTYIGDNIQLSGMSFITLIS